MSKIDTHHSASPNKSKKYLPALAAVGVLAVAGIAGLKGGGKDSNIPESNKPGLEAEAPPATLYVSVDEAGVWGAAQQELIDSGHVDADGQVSIEAVSELTDKSMALNQAADPTFNARKLQPGQQIIMVDVPDKNNG